MEGEPWHIGGRRLQPVAKLTSIGPRAGNWGLRWLHPVCVREVTEEGAHEIAIRGGGIPFFGIVAAIVAPVALWLLAKSLSGKCNT